jgi:hypothetical protein
VEADFVLSVRDHSMRGTIEPTKRCVGEKIMVCVVAWTEASLKASHSCLSMYRLLQHDIYSPYPVLHFAHPVHSCSFFIFWGAWSSPLSSLPHEHPRRCRFDIQGFHQPPWQIFLLNQPAVLRVCPVPNSSSQGRNVSLAVGRVFNHLQQTCRRHSSQDSCVTTVVPVPLPCFGIAQT